MKKQYSKRRTRARKTRSRRQRRQRQRTHKRHRRGGAMDQVPVPIERHISTITYSIMESINRPNGRWSRDFYIIDQNTCKMKVSASNNEGNQTVMNNFAQNLQQKIQEINHDLASRTDPPVSINNLQVLDITREEVRAMSQDPHFVSLYYDSVEEDLEDWEGAIHKLIVFSVN
jgi:hypothetical protein